MRPRTRTIVSLALPIVGGMVSQNLMNLADTAMVGSLGDAPLAATGIGGFALFTTIAFFMGLGSGVQAMVARRIGEGRPGEAVVPLNGGILMAVAFAAPLSILLIVFTPEIFGLLVSDPAVAREGVPYFRARLVGTVGFAINYSFRGFWVGHGLSSVYMRSLFLSHASNVFLNWVLIFGNLGAPELGTLGAGVGSAIATGIGTAYHLAVLASRGELRLAAPELPALAAMLRLSVPAGLQQFFFAAGFTVLFWIVGRVGTAELAAANVLLTLTLVMILPAVGLGLAAATLAGQALGRGDPADARRWGYDVVRLGMIVMTLPASLVLLVPDLLLSGFLHDPSTLALARTPLRIIAVTMLPDVVGLVMLNALLGAGDTLRVFAASATMQWGLFLPAAWTVGPRLGLGLTAIWATLGLWRTAQAMVFTAMWHRGKWTRSRA